MKIEKYRYGRRIVTQTLGSALLIAALSALPAHSSGEEKHDKVLQQLQSNEIMSLADILEMIGPKISGEIIETEFEYEDGLPVYEFKYISNRGRVREMYVDARSGKIIKDELD